MNLCQCNHREEIGPGKFLCQSNRFVKTKGFVTHKGCGECCSRGYNNLPNLPPGEGAPAEVHGGAFTYSKAHYGWGDRLEDAIKFVRLDWLARYYEGLTGKGCGCSTRRDKLNELGKKTRKQILRLFRK